MRAVFGSVFYWEIFTVISKYWTLTTDKQKFTYSSISKKVFMVLLGSVLKRNLLLLEKKKSCLPLELDTYLNIANH